MARAVGGRIAHRLAIPLALAALLTTVLPVTHVAAATDRLPDLRAAYIKDLRIVRSDGRRLLRFTGMMYNTGAGPLDIRARRATRSSPWDVDQIVYNTAEAGISSGRGVRLACPDKAVTRGQMVAMLHRGIGP